MGTRPAFDEIMGQAGSKVPRPELAALGAWIDDTPDAELRRRQQSAEATFRQLGITFAVYGDSDASERIIPFDIVPRVFLADEWARLSAGLVQRVEAINAFLHDIYGERRILAEGVLPPDLIFGNPQFRPEIAGIRPPHDIWAHICGIDLVRTGPDDFFVLEDNARTPSGVSYMLENREAMLRLCPELFRDFRVAAVDSYPDRLLQTMQSVAPDGVAAPVCVVLTPGHYNSAYYEHSFLADSMGVELVEAADLIVDDDVVWMRTIAGRVKVDVIYRRIDDDYLDPLVFRPDSMLGVPGLIAAYAAGNVALINAPGNGIADDKAIYSYMPEIVKFYSGGDPKLPNVETWRCREPQALKYVLDNLKDVVVKLVDGSGGYGMLVGPDRDQSRDRDLPRRADRRAAPLHRAADAGAVDRADSGRCGAGTKACRFPAVRADGVEGRAGRPRRAYPRGAQRGLARRELVARRRDEGQFRADGWWCAPPSTDAEPGLMLSRTASSLYWLGRYVERTDFIARLVEATVRLDVLSPRPAGEAAWASALAVTETDKAFAETKQTITQNHVARFLTLDSSHPGSIVRSLDMARNNARAVRTALTKEAWTGINRAWLIFDNRTNPGGAMATLNLVEAVKAETRGFEGAIHRMLRNQTTWFIRLGQAVERADNTARLLDVKYHILLPEGEAVGGVVDRDQWTTILQTVSAVTAYRWLYSEGLKPANVIDLLIARPELPRSLAASVEEAVDILNLLAKRTGLHGEADRMARNRHMRLAKTRSGQVIAQGLHQYLQGFIAENDQLHLAVGRQFKFT